VPAWLGERGQRLASTTRARRIWRGPLLVVAAVIAALLTIGLWLLVRSARSVNQPISLGSVNWILYREDLIRMQTADPSVFQPILSGPSTFMLEHSATGNAPAGAEPAELFFSYAAFQTALQNGSIIPGVKFVAYDPEDWPATPMLEQQDPRHYLQLFGQTAQANGYKAILIPGRDLMQVPGAVCGQQKGETLSAAYVRCGLPATAAYASVYVIQAASLELDLPSLRQLVQSSAAAARAANPAVTTFATLSTIPPGGGPTSATALNKAARTILPYVQGLELNSTAATDTRMIAFLHLLAGQ
jgi:hypothetical protein